MHETTQLKSCPFCGNKATRLNKEFMPYSDSRGHVRCTNCPAEMNSINQETADAWWNHHVSGNHSVTSMTNNGIMMSE